MHRGHSSSQYPREGSNTKPNRTFPEMLLTWSSFMIQHKMLACGVRTTNMTRRRKLLFSMGRERCCAAFGWKTCWRVTCCGVKRVPYYDLGEERHFPVRLVLDLMLFVR
ncbi:hypothetical protein LEMLEM_LOCUS7596 [Lemmus lemmus]